MYCIINCKLTYIIVNIIYYYCYFILFALNVIRGKTKRQRHNGKELSFMSGHFLLKKTMKTTTTIKT